MAVMFEETSLLTANLVEAFKQLNQFVTLALVSSVSALALDNHAKPAGPRTKASAAPDEKVAVVGGFAPMSRDAAQLLFVGICYVAALMGSYSLQSASYIINRLGASSQLVDAACTYSSVVTGPVGIRVAGAAVPAILAGVVIAKKWWRLREPGLFWMLTIFIGTYAILGVGMSRLPCVPH
jgi:hypothetical protein